MYTDGQNESNEPIFDREFYSRSLELLSYGSRTVSLKFTRRYQGLPEGLPVATRGYQMLPGATMSYQGLPGTTRGYQGLLGATMDYQGLPQITPFKN